MRVLTSRMLRTEYERLCEDPVNGQRDFPVGGQVISPSADS